MRWRPQLLSVIVSIEYSCVVMYGLQMRGSAAGRVPAFASLTQRKALSRRNLYQVTTSTESSEDNAATRETKYKELMEASRLSLAPMMEYTDRHFRHLVRLISNRTLLYTEMVAANALVHERRDKEDEFISQNPTATPEQARKGYDDQFMRRYLGQGLIQPLEGASVLQLGGSDPQQMYEAAQTVMDMTDRGWCDYTAINLNCGCPSPKVAGKGCFGAALMDDPDLVAELTSALHDGTGGKLPVTVKCRIGTSNDQSFTRKAYDSIDPEMEYSKLCSFIERVAANNVVTDFSVHARIAVLQKSFSPADNRKIPPLKRELVRRLVQDYPELTFSVNGGIGSLTDAQTEFDECPGLLGVMVGRSFAAQPWNFAMADRLLYKDDSCRHLNRLEILQEYGRHADEEENLWDPAKIRRFIVKAVCQLFAGEPNSKRYRIELDEIASLPKKYLREGVSLSGKPPISELILNAATKHLSEDVLLRSPEETFERLLWEEDNRQSHVVGNAHANDVAA